MIKTNSIAQTDYVEPQKKNSPSIQSIQISSNTTSTIITDGSCYTYFGRGTNNVRKASGDNTNKDSSSPTGFELPKTVEQKKGL